MAQTIIQWADGLTLEVAQKKYPWLFDPSCNYDGAIVGEDSNGLIMYQAEWLAGEFKGYTWVQGFFTGIFSGNTWKGGHFLGGTFNGNLWIIGDWQDGIWNGTTWTDGGWIKGTWNNGIWIIGSWTDGTWNNGTWQGGIWNNGTWVAGQWFDGKWINGTIKDINWVDGLFVAGTFNGIWNNGRFSSGTFNSGTWRQGVFVSGTFVSGAWEDGIFLNGTIIQCTWKNGKLNQGIIHDITWGGGMLMNVTNPDSVVTGPVYTADQKLNKLRDIRDSILDRASWISQRWNDESYAVSQGLMTVDQMSCTSAQFVAYLQWKLLYCNLPQTLDLTQYSIDDINIANLKIFPPSPIDLRLTPIGNN